MLIHWGFRERKKRSLVQTSIPAPESYDRCLHNSDRLLLREASLFICYCLFVAICSIPGRIRGIKLSLNVFLKKVY